MSFVVEEVNKTYKSGIFIISPLMDYIAQASASLYIDANGVATVLILISYVK